MPLRSKRKQSVAMKEIEAKRCRRNTDQNELPVVKDFSLQKLRKFYDERDRYFKSVDGLLQMTEKMKSESRLFNSLHKIFCSGKVLLEECVDSVSKEVCAAIKFDETGKEINKPSSSSSSIDVQPPTIDFSPIVILKRENLSPAFQSSAKNQAVMSNENVPKKASAQEQSVEGVKIVKCSDKKSLATAELTIKNLVLHNENLGKSYEKSAKPANVSAPSSSVHSTKVRRSIRNGDQHSSVSPDLDAKNQKYNICLSTPKDKLLFSKPRDLVVSAERYCGPSVTKLFTSNDSVASTTHKTQQKKDSSALLETSSVVISSGEDKPSQFDLVDKGHEIDKSVLVESMPNKSTGDSSNLKPSQFDHVDKGHEVDKSVLVESMANKSMGDNSNLKPSSSSYKASKKRRTVSKVNLVHSISMSTIKPFDCGRISNDKSEEKACIRSKIQGKHRSTVHLEVVNVNNDITLISPSKAFSKTSITEESASSITLFSTPLESEPSLNASKLSGNTTKESTGISRERLTSSEEAKENVKTKSVPHSRSRRKSCADKFDSARKGNKPLVSSRYLENNLNSGANKSDASYENIGCPQSESTPISKQPLVVVSNISNSDDHLITNDLDDINLAARLSLRPKNCRGNHAPDLPKTMKIKDFSSEENKNVILTQNKKENALADASLCTTSAKKLKNLEKKNGGSNTDSFTSTSMWKVVLNKPGKLSIKNIGKKTTLSNPVDPKLKHYIHQRVDEIIKPDDCQNTLKKQKNMEGSRDKKKNETSDDLMQGSSDKPASEKILGRKKRMGDTGDRFQNDSTDVCYEVSFKSSTSKMGQDKVDEPKESILTGNKEKRRGNTSAAIKKFNERNETKLVDSETGKSLKTTKQTRSTGKRKSTEGRKTSEESDIIQKHLYDIIEKVASNSDLKSSEVEVLNSQNNVNMSSSSERFEVSANPAKENEKSKMNGTIKQRFKLKRDNSSATFVPEDDRITLKKAEIEGKSDGKVESGDSECGSSSGSGTSSSDTSSSNQSASGSFNKSSSVKETTSVVQSDRTSLGAPKECPDIKKDVSNRLETEKIRPKLSRSKSLGVLNRTSSSDKTPIPMSVLLQRPREKKVQPSSKQSHESGKSVKLSQRSKESSSTEPPQRSYQSFEQKRKEILNSQSIGKSSSITFRRVSSVENSDDKRSENSKKPDLGTSNGRRSKTGVLDSFSSPLEPGNSRDTKLSYSKAKVSSDPKVKNDRVSSLQNRPKTSNTEKKPSHSSKSSFDKIGDHKSFRSDKSKQALLPCDLDDDVINLNTSPIVSDEENDDFGRSCDGLEKQLTEYQPPKSSCHSRSSRVASVASSSSRDSHKKFDGSHKEKSPISNDKDCNSAVVSENGNLPDASFDVGNTHARPSSRLRSSQGFGCDSPHETSDGVSPKPIRRERSRSAIHLGAHNNFRFENSSEKGDSEFPLTNRRRQSVESWSNGVNVDLDGRGQRHGNLDCRISLTRCNSEPALFSCTEPLEPFVKSKPKSQIDLSVHLKTLRTGRLPFTEQVGVMCNVLCQSNDDIDKYFEILRGLCDFICDSREQEPHSFLRSINARALENHEPGLTRGALLRPLGIISSNLIVRAYEKRNLKEVFELYNVSTKECEIDLTNKNVQLFDDKYSSVRFALILIEVLAHNYAANPIFLMMKRLNLYSLNAKKWEGSYEQSDIKVHRDICELIFRRLMDRRADKAAERLAAENSLKLALTFIILNNNILDVFNEMDVDIHDIFSRLFEFELFKDICVASEKIPLGFFRIKNILRGLIVAAARQNNLKHAVKVMHVAHVNSAYPRNPFRKKDLVISIPSFVTDDELNPYLQYYFKTRISSLQSLDLVSISFKIDANIAPDKKYLFPFLNPDSKERLRSLPEKVVELLRDLFNITAAREESVVSVDHPSFLLYINANQSNPAT